MRAFDLHVHSLRSDGTRTPADVVGLAAEAGLAGLALTDHDTVAGWAEAAAAAEPLGLDLVPGIELSAERDGASVHVLGLWVDGEDAALAAECRRLAGERARRADAMLEALAQLGAPVDRERVLALAGDAPIGRPHVAQALVETGRVPDIDTAFDRYLAEDRPAWVPKQALDPVDAVALVRGAGGVAVLAHPGLFGRDGLPLPLLDEVTGAGLAGVEADHPHHEPPVVEHWRRQAAERGLLVTGGSDFHGARKAVRIGARTTPVDVVEALRARRAQPRATARPPGRGTAPGEAAGADGERRRALW